MMDPQRARELNDILTELEGLSELEVYQRIMDEAVLRALNEINAVAEADMLRGNPVTGAHHRALEAKRIQLQDRRKGEGVTKILPIVKAVVEEARLDEARLWMKAVCTAEPCGVSVEDLGKWMKNRVADLEARRKDL